MLLLFSNNAQTTLAGPIASNAVSMNLAAGTGSEFPAPISGQQYFVMTLNDQSTKLVREIIWVTARSGDTCTILRAQEGTSARAWLASDIAANWWTAGQAATMIQSSQLQIQATNFANDTGSVNNIQITLVPPPATLVSIIGAPIRIKMIATNTGNTSLTIVGLSATTVFAQGGASTISLPAGSLIGGQIYEFTYVNGVGFEVSTVKAILSTQNTWATSQAVLNNTWWSALNTGGTIQPLIGLDSFNNTTVWAGPSGSTAWRVLSNNGSQNLLYSSSSGVFHALGGIVADTGDISTVNGNVTALGGHLRSSQGARNSGDLAAATLLNDFTFTYDTTNKFSMIWPNNFSVQMISQSVAVIVGTVTTTVNLRQPFPSNIAGAVVCFSGNFPPQQVTISCQPSGPGSVDVTTTSPISGGGSVGVTVFACGF